MATRVPGGRRSGRVPGALVLIALAAAAAWWFRQPEWLPILGLLAAGLVLLGLAGGRRAPSAPAVAPMRYATLAEIDPWEFEQLVADRLRRDGWQNVRVTVGSGDYGVDVLANHPQDGSLLAVQCKRWQGSVGVQPVLQFVGGARAHYGARHLLLVTTSSCTPNARQMLVESGCRLIDGTTIHPWLQGRTGWQH